MDPPASAPALSPGTQSGRPGHAELGESLFRGLIDSLPQRVFFKNADSAFIAVNRAFAADLDRAPEALIGKTDFDLFPPELAAKYHRDDRRVIETGEVFETVEAFQRPNGETLYVRVVKSPLYDQGRITGVQGIFWDVTERKQIEEQLAFEHDLLIALLENVPDRIFFKDTQSRFLKCSRNMAERLGVSHPDLIVGKTDFDFHPVADAEEFHRDERHILETGVPLIEKVERQTGMDGGEIWAAVTKVPFRNRAGEITGLIGVSRDITEKKLAEERLRDFATRLERSNRELQDFAYVASHDLQEPLRKIAVFGDRLRGGWSDKLGDDGRDYLQRLLGAAARMKSLIEALLSYSRVTSKGQHFAPVDLDRVVHEVIEDLAARLDECGGRVKVEPLPVIEADPMQMRQLFQNLIGNALKFRRPEVPPVITITARELPAEAELARPPGAASRSVELTIADNGIGFDEKYRDRIFHMFQRLHGRGVYEGSGMGLAIVRKIAEHHGGDVAVHSRPGEGAAFSVTLPAARVAPATNPGHPAGRPASGQSSPRSPSHGESAGERDQPGANNSTTTAT